MIAASVARDVLPGDAVLPACRGCGHGLSTTFINLGSQPASNAYLTANDLHRAEIHYPLHAYVCAQCFLVQLQAFQTPTEIFGEYAYFSSFSESWLAHGARFAHSVCERERLDAQSFIVEIASNDGYLLRHFRDRGMRVLGVEPAANVARAAVAAGIPTITEFFGEACARELRRNGYVPRLLVANNVLAHVPDLHDFVAGIAILLDADALATIEVPHLLRLIESGEFDTIYHEHFSYFSLLALEPVFAAHGLTVVDVEELATHGGSIRLYVRRTDAAKPNPRVAAIRALEREARLDDLGTYHAFAQRAILIKQRTLSFLLKAQEQSWLIAGYGAPAKGNTFLNYCGVGPDLLAFTVDRSPHKQGRFLPGSHIPIMAPEAIFERRPEYVLILPWNLSAEIRAQMREISRWGGRFVTAIPNLTIHP